MGFLLNKFKAQKETSVSKDFDIDTDAFKPFALLQEEQVDRFIRGLFEGSDAVYDKAYEKTGNKSLTSKVKGSSVNKPMYKIIKGFDEYTYLAAFEALLCGIFGWNENIPGSSLEYGQGTFFNENGFVVRYFKERPLYERSYSKDQDGNYIEEAGISQFLYQSPIGNFIIKQNQVNNRIFELYASEDISEMLLSQLTKALEVALDIKSQSMEKSFREIYRVRVDNSSPSVRLQEPNDIPLPSIEEETK